MVGGETHLVLQQSMYHSAENFFVYPQREFRDSYILKRSFQQSWFSQLPWLHYGKGKDLVFCFVCVNRGRNHIGHGNADKAYIIRGYSNWKKAVGQFLSYKASICHKHQCLKLSHHHLQ